MAKQKTTRANHRHSPTAATQTNKGTSAVASSAELKFVPYVIENKVRRETKAPPTCTETARWLASTLDRYPDFSWYHFAPSNKVIKELQTSARHSNGYVHFQNSFYATSKQFGWIWSRSDVQEAWRHAPKDLKSTWNGIFQNNKPAKASGRKRDHTEIPNSTGSYTNYEPTQAWMPVASTSNGGLYNPPNVSGSWNSPTYFGSPPPNHDVMDAGWHNLYERHPSVAQSWAKIPCSLPSSHSQEWAPPTSSGAHLPSGYSSPASAISPYSAYSGASYFTGTPSSSGSSYRPRGEHLGGSSNLGNGSLLMHQPPYDQYPMVSDPYSQWAPITNPQPKDDAGSWDPLSHQTQLYSSPPSLDFLPDLSVPFSSTTSTTPELDFFHHGNPDVSGTLPSNDPPELGSAFEQPSLFDFLEYHPEGSVQTGSSIEDLLASLNGPVEPDSTFHAGGIGPDLNLAAPMPQGPWPAYEVFPGYLPETGAALGCHPPSNPRYFNEAD